jgi:hypothetical protein
MLCSGALLLSMVFSVSADPSLAGEVGFQTPSQSGATARASAALGNTEQANLALIRELQTWRNRALEAESKASVLKPSAEKLSGQAAHPSAANFNVVGCLEAERVVLVSCGKDSGVFEGALISIGSGVKARVVESRSKVCAAVVENAFQGDISIFDGKPAQLVLVR